jgi:hypothetical protein
VFTHGKNTLLLDAMSFYMIEWKKLKLFNVFKLNKAINKIVFTNCNFTGSGSLLCSVLRDILVANSKNVRIFECVLPSELSERDLKILEINSRQYNLQSLEVINCEMTAQQRQCLSKLVQILSNNKEFEFAVRYEA